MKKTISIDGNTALSAPNTLYDGLGFISANNSSRLLMDYKEEHEDAYWEILRYIFGDKGLAMSLIKIEMGADVDSSSGTEPSMKRTATEVANATRGAGAMLVRDAMTINPNIDVDMLYWGIPAWVMQTSDYNKAMYQWYREVIEAMYDEYGIKLTYLTVGQNERELQPSLIKYIANALKQEPSQRYDYSSIKIIAGEGVGTWEIADLMLSDSALMDVVDVISAHYTSFTSDNARRLQQEYNKKIWFSEGSSPMKVAQLTSSKENNRNGLSGINGVLDIATRITQAIANGMTMYEFQPAVSAYYSGATYFPKQLITANEPWSGAYSLDPGYYMALHFGQFFKKNMQIIKSACFGDGRAGGDGHAIVDSTYNYIAMKDATNDDYSILIVNATSAPIEYTIELSNLATAGNSLNLWITRETDDEDYCTGLFKQLAPIVPTKRGEIYEAELIVPAYSIVTLTTFRSTLGALTDRADANKLLSLPYRDDFGYDIDYLSRRGGAPRYTTDQGGAFEVVKHNNQNVLMQKISYDIKPIDWGGTSEPITTLGDDCWKNYSVSIDIHFADEEIPTEEINYIGIGVRYNLADNNQSGYILKLNSQGRLSLMKDNDTLCEALIAIDSTNWHTLKLEANGNNIIGYLDGYESIHHEDCGATINSGRAAIYSDYQNNYYRNLIIDKIDDAYYVRRIDDMDSSIIYSKGSSEEPECEGIWYFQTLSSFKNYNRTLTTGTLGCEMCFAFRGIEFALIGLCENATINVCIDNVETRIECNTSDYRQCFYCSDALSDTTHTVRIAVQSGAIHLDAIEFRQAEMPLLR